MIAKQPEQIDNTCRYVRQVSDKWEYGVIERLASGVNKRNKLGDAQTYEAALSDNNMTT